MQVPTREQFDQLLHTRRARVAVIGLGYAGLPLAIAYARAGFSVLGVDADPARIAVLAQGRSPIADVVTDDVARVRASGHLEVEASYDRLVEADVVFICVPTPCTRNKEPDTTNIAAAARGIAEHLRPGQLVVLRSTSYPGTTEELILPLLKARGYRVGRDVFLAFAPERVDPGRQDFTVENTPVVVGGTDPESTHRTARLFEVLGPRVFKVSSPAAAEMAKLLENVFRNVNIALVNQVGMLCDRMGLDVWEIVDAAATKPYGFLRFLPGPGVGGHCIPVDPYYLSWKAREYDFHMDFIELAARVNEEMPYHVVTKTMLALRNHRAGDRAARVLVVGVAFKRDVDDYRGSPALKIMELLGQRDVEVSYHDPYVAECFVGGRSLASRPLTAATLRGVDCALIVADHTGVDYRFIVRHARMVVDTRNATRDVVDGRHKIIRL